MLKSHTINKKIARNGFTLVELIVVLVILAILAVLLIPALTGYIDKANQRAAIAEARACLSALQTIAVEKYSAGQVYDLAQDEPATLALAEAPAAADLREARLNAKAKVTKMVYRTGSGILLS